MFGWFKKDPAAKAPAAPKANDLASVIVLHLSGDLESARKGYLNLMELNPGKVAPTFLLSTVLVQLDRSEEATALLDNLANPAAMVAELEAAGLRDRRGALVEVMLSAGDVLKRGGEFNLSCAWFKTATELDPRSAEALYRYADTLHDLRLFSQAEQFLRAALLLDPEHWASLYTCGVLQQDLGRDAEAVTYYERALKVNEGHAKLHNNLGSALLNIGRAGEALPHFQRAVELDQGLAHAHANLGTVYSLVGHWRGALAAFENAMSVGATPGIWVKHALVMPPVPASKEEILAARNRMQVELAELSRANITLRDPLREVGMTPFYLAYQGEDDLPLLRQLAHFYSVACPQLNHIAKQSVRAARSGEPRKLRVGFVSTFLYGHTVGREIHQVIRKLSRERFEVVAISTFAREDEITRAIVKDADESVTIPMILAGAQQAIEDARLDILVYADCGLDPLTYFLGFARLAPVQIAFHGHPVTTGVPNMDFFLSHESCETGEAADHYSEQLLCLGEEVAYTCFDRPVAAATTKTRADFVLEESAHLYLCPQSLFEIHPDCDRLFARILEADPAGQLLIFEREQPEWNNVLRERLLDAGIQGDRLRFLSRMDRDDFLEVLRLADVVLDALHYDGGTTSLDALAMGTPVVTLPGEHLRGRRTACCYQRMEIEECIADSEEEYVEIAVGIASEPRKRAELSRRILDAAPALFEDLGMVREFERLLEEAYEGRTQR